MKTTLGQLTRRAIVLAAACLTAAHSGLAHGQFAPQPVAVAPAPPPRSPVVVGLPVPEFNEAGELQIRPNVSAAAWNGTGPEMPLEMLPPPGPEGWQPSPPSGAAPSPLSELGNRIQSVDPSDMIWAGSEPLIPWEEVHSWAHRPTSPTGEPGVGRERVMFAPFMIDITQPFSHLRFRFDAAYHLRKPDRAEYFWGRPGRGPAIPERSVDYQDIRFQFETGGDSFSVATDIPIRMLNPEINGNTAGMGDMQLVQRTVLLNGDRWQITQLLRNVFSTGSARKGLGTGHTTMEPGVLFRYKSSELTFYHGELKLAFPLGGDPVYSGPVLSWGVGVSHLYYETDTVAFIPTLEFTNLWVLDGQVTPFPGGVPVDVDGDGIFNLGPGLRVVCDTGGDLGVVEMGLFANIAIASDGWYDALLRFDVRFVY